MTAKLTPYLAIALAASLGKNNEGRCREEQTPLRHNKKYKKSKKKAAQKSKRANRR